MGRAGGAPEAEQGAAGVNAMEAGVLTVADLKMRQTTAGAGRWPMSAYARPSKQHLNVVCTSNESSVGDA